MSMSASRMFTSITRDQTQAQSQSQFTNGGAAVATSPPQSPASPSRSGRLRGLNYLRSYTQNHLLSRDSREAREGSSGSPTAQSPALPSPRSASVPVQNDFFSQPASATNNPIGETACNTSGWLPSVGGQSVASRVATDPLPSAAASSSAVLSPATSSATSNMARTRSMGASQMPTTPPVDSTETQSPADATAVRANGMAHQLPSIRFSSHPDPRSQRPSLVFSPMTRILPTGHEVVKVGRYSERDNLPSQSMNVPSSAPVGFKSKVVSRKHCEFWCQKGKWYIKDVKSSSGTFLNHIRLSAPGAESKPFPINDGDIVQLGIDFKGGEEMIFRCVKIRIELNKGWQSGPSNYNVQSHKRLRELNNSAGSSSQDCSICLGAIAPCQSLFVAPCSHAWHYKCIRVIINGPHFPHFICPNCRAVADLEAEVDEPYVDGEWEEAEVEAEDESPTSHENGTVGPRTRQRSVNGEATPIMPQTVTSPLGGNRSYEDISEEDINRYTDMNLNETDQSDSDQNISPGTPPGPVNDHSTVPPVDIVARKATTNTIDGVASHMEQTLNSRRTPTSPHVGSPDPLSGVEGPMTPTNDAGPFILDGSGKSGRNDAPRLGFLSTSANAGTSAGSMDDTQPARSAS